jgi:hypothetical protein
MNDWIELSEMRPNYGQRVFFKERAHHDIEAIRGTYEHTRICMIGTPNGVLGEGFQDDYNRLPCEGDLWIDEASFIPPRGYIEDK